MMNEVAEIKRKIDPQEVLLVVDAMIGQEAAELTRRFNDEVGITGAILTKMDGDSKGGAALSIKKISGKPIKLVGTGEKVEALEPFYPERMAGRILGMGDILSLVDRAQKEVEMNDMVTIQKKFQDASFDFDDFVKQLRLIKSMGSLGGIMKLIPGMNKVDDLSMKTGEIQLIKFQSMIGSMTKEERRNPDLLLKSTKRRKRIACGSGYGENDVEKMVTDFTRMRKMMQGITNGNISGLTNLMKGTKEREVNAKELTKTPQKSKSIKKKKGFFEL
jgi:signal recognition particle subunit SRP54